MSSSRSIRRNVLTLRVTPGERAVLAGRAAVAGLPLSSYLRHAVLARRVRSTGNRLVQADIDDLRALGHRLNHFAHAANTVRRIVGFRDLVELGDEITETVSDIADRLAE